MSFGPTLYILDNDKKRRKIHLFLTMKVVKTKMKAKLKQIPKILLKVKILRSYKKMQIKLGFKSLHYSKRKNSKDFVTLESGKKVHFGLPKYEDY